MQTIFYIIIILMSIKRKQIENKAVNSQRKCHPLFSLVLF
jgi:hypothetical protein